MYNDNNYLSFFYEKFEDFLDYIKTFFNNKENEQLYIDKIYKNEYISFHKIDEEDVDKLINEMKNEIKFDKDYLELENRYQKLVKDINEIEKKKEKDEEEEEEDDDEENDSNKPDNGELIAVPL
jgi:hypothetical protein